MNRFAVAAIIAGLALSGWAEAKTAPSRVAVAVSNTMSVTRTDKVVIDSPFDVEKVQSVVVTDGQSSVPAQLSGDEITIIARGIPGGGCRLYWIEPGTASYHTGTSGRSTVIENQFLRVKVDPGSGAISGILCKRLKTELVPKSCEAGVLEMVCKGAKEPLVLKQTDLIESGPCKATIRSEFEHGKTSLVEDVTVYDSIPRVDVKITVDWQEDPGTTSLRLLIPVGVQDGKVLHDSGGKTNSGWVDFSNDRWGVSLFGVRPFPCSVEGKSMIVTLVSPDVPAKPGIFEADCAIYPHDGNFNKASADEIAEAMECPLRATTAEAAMSGGSK